MSNNENNKNNEHNAHTAHTAHTVNTDNNAANVGAVSNVGTGHNNNNTSVDGVEVTDIQPVLSKPMGTTQPTITTLDDSTTPPTKNSGVAPTPTKKLVVVAAIVAASVGLAATGVYGVKHSTVETPHGETVNTLQQKTPDPILLNNTIIVNETGDKKPESVGIEGDDTGFVFASKTHHDATTKPKIVDVYLSFSAGRGVNMLLNNLEQLKSAVDDNKIILILHPVTTDNELSELIPEALGLATEKNGSLTWGMLENSLAVASITNDNKYPVEVATQAIVNDLNGMGVTATVDSLKQRSFGQWLFSKQKETQKKLGGEVPSIYVDGKPVDKKNINIQNPSELMKEILQG